MTAFTTNLSLGDMAYGVAGWPDPRVQYLTVGQIRVTETAPKARSYGDDPCYKEEYMCLETGVGSGTIWEYGKNIFSNLKDAEAGVIKQQQAAWKERAERAAAKAKYEAEKEASELAQLRRLKEKYEQKEVEAA